MFSGAPLMAHHWSEIDAIELIGTRELRQGIVIEGGDDAEVGSVVGVVMWWFRRFVWKRVGRCSCQLLEYVVLERKTFDLATEAGCCFSLMCLALARVRLRPCSAAVNV